MVVLLSFPVAHREDSGGEPRTHCLRSGRRRFFDRFGTRGVGRQKSGKRPSMVGEWRPGRSCLVFWRSLSASVSSPRPLTKRVTTLVHRGILLATLCLTWVVLVASTRCEARFDARQDASKKAKLYANVWLSILERRTVRSSCRVRPTRVGLLMLQSARCKKTRRQRAQRTRLHEPHLKIAPIKLLADQFSLCTGQVSYEHYIGDRF